MNTRPFAAIGAIGIVTPGAFASISWSHNVWPSFASSASTCASDVPRNKRPSRYAKPRCTPSGDGRSSGRSTFHFSAQVAASIAYERVSVVKYIVPATTIGPVCSAETSGNV